jgi:hypothetical protein
MFTPIHKGMRRLLFETAMAIARTDFGAPDEVAATEPVLFNCLRFLEDHAAHEDRHVFPVVARLAPDFAAAMAPEHPALERAAREIHWLWERLRPLAGPARVALGGDIQRRFLAYVADHLRHMDKEEREVNAILWAHLADTDLLAINGRIVADIEPARLREFGAVLAQALNRRELEVMERAAGR